MPADNPIDIERRKILKRIGYDADYVPSGRIISLVDDYIENYHDFLAPMTGYTLRSIAGVSGERIDLGDGIILESRILAGLLSRCERVAVFAITIGHYLEEMVAYLAESGLMLHATVLDAIGSGAAEKLANDFGERFGLAAARFGQVTSRRFSPGYCDWPVEQQEMVFRALGDSNAGVQLNESHLMTPRKSVSGIIGIGPAGRGIVEYNPCPTCREKDCPGRRK